MWPGIPAIFNDSSATSSQLTMSNGHAFDLQSVGMVGELTWFLPEPTAWLVGTHPDGTTVTQTLAHTGPNGLQTFTLTGFTNLASLTWEQNESGDGLPAFTDFVVATH